MSQFLSIRAYVRTQRQTVNGSVPIYLSITIDGLRKPFAFGEKVNVKAWNQEEQVCTGKSAEAIRINVRITQAKGDLTRIFSSIPAKERVTPDDLLGLYLNEIPNVKKNKKDLGFQTAVLDHIDKWLDILERRKVGFKDCSFRCDSEISGQLSPLAR